jgi:hypothetical protein
MTREWCPSPEPSSLCPFGSLQLSLKFPFSELPRLPNGLLQRETPVSKAFFYPFPSKSPVNEPPPPCSPTGVLWREKPHLRRQWFIYIWVLNKEPSHEKTGKTFGHRPRSPTWTEDLHTLGAAWFPKRIVNDTAVSTPVSCSPQHDTFHLGLGWPEPC